MAKSKTNWNTLIALLAIVVIAAIGLLTSFVPKISGAAEGNVSVTLAGAASITLTDSIVDFGTGTVTGDYAFLDSNSTSHENWTVTTQGSNGWPSQTDYIVIQNNGNVNVGIQIFASKTASDFIGSNAEQYFAGVDDSGACASGLARSYTTLTTTPTTLCGSLNWPPSPNSLRVAFKLKIPSTASTGPKTNTITFSAYQV